MKSLIWDFFEIFIIILETAIFAVYISKMVKFKVIDVWKKILYVLLFPATILISDFFKVDPTIKLVCLIFMGGIIIKLISNASIKEIIKVQVVWALISVISEVLVVSILMLLNNFADVELVLERNDIRLQLMFITKPVNFIGLILFARNSKISKYSYSFKEIMIILIQTGSSLLCLFAIVEMSLKSMYKMNSYLIILMSFFVLISFIISYFALDDYFVKKQKEKEWFKMDNYMKQQYDYYSSLDRSNQEIKKMYHDIKKHFNTLRYIDGMDEESKLYLDKLFNRVKKAEGYYDTGNPIADIILNHKKELADNLNISMEVVIERGCLNSIESQDICTIFSNALDNGIEACERNITVNKRIKVRAFKNEQGTFICFENTIEIEPEYRNGRLITSKKDKKEHGIGVFSIESTVDQYDGEVNIDIEKGKFVLLVWIPDKIK